MQKVERETEDLNSEDLKNNLVLIIQKIKSNLFGPLSLHYDYKHVGKVEDWKNGSVRAKVDSTDIMNISLSKDINKMKWFLNITNLTDEVYERPDTYNQERRKIGLSFMHKY